MSEMIYTHINPKDITPSSFRQREKEITDFAESIYDPKEDKVKELPESIYNHRGKDIIDGLKSIKKDGIKFPVVCECTDKKYKGLSIGYRRLLIALALGLKKIPAVLWSEHHKTGHQGQLINEKSDIVDMFGEEIKDQDTYSVIMGAFKKLPYPINNV